MSGITLGDAPSWILVVVIGIGILAGLNEGILKYQYSLGNANIPIESIGTLMLVGGLALGGFYFMKDISNK
jgi:hypothetical protein